jgi:hypothetical protein
MTIELSFEQIMAIIGVAQLPTWGLLAWILKVQRNTCERLVKEETKSAIYHK